MKKVVVVIISFLWCGYGFTQEFNHFLFGTEKFEGIEIYDVVQDVESNYIFATNQGLIIHDGYSYKNMSCPKMLGKSVFQFKKDNVGSIYCNNLHGQVFKIVNQEVKLFYEIPSYKTSYLITLQLTADNEVLIISNVLILLNQYGEELSTLNYSDNMRSVMTSSFAENNFIYASGNKCFDVIEVNKGVITQNFSNQEVSISNWVEIEDQVYGLDNSTMTFYKFNLETYEFSPYRQILPELKDVSTRLYVINNTIWIAGNTNGVHIFDMELNPLFQGELLYEDFFISDVFKDDEDNILLSTFNNSILVVTDPNIKSIDLPNNDKCISIDSDGDKSLFIGTIKGDIFEYNTIENKLNKLHSNIGNARIEHIYYWKGQKSLFYSSHNGYELSRWNYGVLTDAKFFDYSLKDIAFISSTKALIAVNRGVIELTTNGIDYSQEMKKLLSNRSYCVAWDGNDELIYAGLTGGMVIVKDSTLVEKVKLNNNPVLVNSIENYKNKIYVGSKEHGILIYLKGKLVNQIQLKDEVKQIQIANDKIYVQTLNEFLIYDLNGKQLFNFNQSNGYLSSKLICFKVLDDKIYMVNADFINIIDLNKIETENVKIPIHIDSLKIDDIITDNNVFKSSLNKIEFSYSCRTLKHRDHIYYRYKLEGYSDVWETNTYQNNSVKYNGLAPGHYQFIVQSVNGDMQSDSARFKFEITAPFYQEIWFYVLLLIIVAILIIFFYSIRISKINKRNIEALEKQKIQRNMIESELKALRSQMNPHFIFNSLNSIQELILNEETDNSYDYIVLFSELVRNTLNFSNQEFIPFDKEVAFLNTYLSLEKLRFKDDFEYVIETNGIHGVEIPSLLIQPFIENALIHGLLHNEGLKKLSLIFKRDKEGLFCIVEDNGVGREKAREIQNRRGGSHQSFALGAIAKRLEMLNAQNEGSFSYHIEDLYNEGVASGTKVTIKLPSKHFF